MRPAGVVVSIASVRLRNPALASAKPLHDGQHIAERTREPVEFPHHEHIALAELIQKPMKFGPVPAPARRFLAIDPLASRRLERGHLRGGFLFAGGDPGVADQHCTNVSPMVSIKQYLFATLKPQ